MRCCCVNQRLSIRRPSPDHPKFTPTSQPRSDSNVTKGTFVTDIEFYVQQVTVTNEKPP